MASSPPPLPSPEAVFDCQECKKDRSVTWQAATCTELQQAVCEMRAAFTLALHQLSSLQAEEREERQRQVQARQESERQLAEALTLLITFKAELGTTQQAILALQERTRGLELSVQALAEERDALTHELLLCGSLPPAARLRAQGATPGSPSGAPSSDSGVALLLERAHAAFSAAGVVSSGLSPSSPGADKCSPLSLVQDYVAALAGELSNDDAEVCGSGGQQSRSREDHKISNNERVSRDDDCDSECSLSLAAAKSLSLSTSLGQQCGLELEGGCQHDEEEDEVHSSGSSSAAVEAVQQNSETERRRLAVARELLEAEQMYCQTLHVMNEAFAEPLRTSGILAATDLNTLFPEEVWQLKAEHGALLAGLRTRVASWGPGTRLGDLLQRLLGQVLTLYTSYANAFPEVLQTFHRLCRASPAFTRFLKSCLQRPACAELDLGSLLLTPVQHMPRLVLLLRQLLQATPPTCPDHGAIAACLARLREFLARLNDSMEHSFQLVAAQIGAQRTSRHQHVSRNTHTKPSRRSASHSRAPCRAETRSNSRDFEAPTCGTRRRGQRPQSARPTAGRRANSEWVLPSGKSSHHHRRGRPCRPHTSDEDDESDMMLSSSEELHDSTSGLCDTSPPAGFSALSEPSLLETSGVTSQGTSSGPLMTSNGGPSSIQQQQRPLGTAHSVHNVSKNVTYVARTFWSESRCDLASGGKEGNDSKPTKKKKRSLRASLKSILTFRKRCVNRSIEASPPPKTTPTAGVVGGLEAEKSFQGSNSSEPIGLLEEEVRLHPAPPEQCRSLKDVQGTYLVRTE